MELIKSILTDLDNKTISKHQAYELIMILLNDSKWMNENMIKRLAKEKSSGDFRDDGESQSEYFGY